MDQKNERRYDYEQYLSDGLRTLYFDDPRYATLRELIENDDELIFAVRKDEIHIYYRGGRILKLTKSHNKIKFAFDMKYAKIKKGSTELNEYGALFEQLNKIPATYDEKKWIEHFNDLKSCMKYYRENVSRNPERKLQQDLELNNRDFKGEVIIVDNEYGVREEHRVGSKLCKVDLVSLYKDNGEYKVCLIELKLGDGAIDKKAGIVDHINDYKTFVDTRRNDIIASINNLVEYKRANNFLRNVPDNFKLSEDTEICVSILCYNLPKDKTSKVLSYIRDDISFKLHCNTRLNDDCLQLFKKDILGELL